MLVCCECLPWLDPQGADVVAMTDAGRCHGWGVRAWIEAPAWKGFAPQCMAWKQLAVGHAPAQPPARLARKRAHCFKPIADRKFCPATNEEFQLSPSILNTVNDHHHFGLSMPVHRPQCRQEDPTKDLETQQNNRYVPEAMREAETYRQVQFMPI